MLQENKYYIMVIIFDKKQYTLPIVTGKNPKFNFDQTIVKEMKYEEMENKFMEIILYTLPIDFDIFSQKIDILLQQSTVYSAFKIDLLTVALGPENHNIVLLDLKKKFVHLGRISYTIECKQIDDINILIKSVKIELNHLLQNDISLKLKYRDNKKQYNTKYTKTISATLLNKEEKTLFEYYNNSPNTNPLVIRTKTSMLDLRSSDSSINLYSIRLIDISNQQLNKKDSNNDNNSFFENNPEFKKDNNEDIKLINQYSLIGFSSINFLNVLSENDQALNKQTSQFFRQVSGFNKKTEVKNGENDNSEIFTFQVFLDLTTIYKQPLFSNGVEIGTCELDIQIDNIPLMRQIMYGVMTESGFEINSIHLYDNIISNGNNENSLPSDLQTLINQKRRLNSELVKQKQIQSESLNEFNSVLLKILIEIKSTLEKSIEDNVLYYGYSNDNNLYTGQNVMLDLGMILIEVIDKLNTDQRIVTFQILKIINERSEFDLGTISKKWFIDINNDYKKETKFLSDDIIKNKIIENFIDFNYSCLEYSLECLSRGNTVDNPSKIFTEFFLSVVYFRIPIFRNVFIEIISKDVTERISNHIIKTYPNRAESEEDFMELDPINNLILWQNLFYIRLESALKNHKNDNDNEINEKLEKIKNLINDNKTDNLRNQWREKLSKKDFQFFSLVQNLINYINQKAETGVVNLLNIPGFENIINAILHEIQIRHVKAYPKQLIELFPLFINNDNVVNEMVKRIILKTNVYDVTGIFNLIDIIDLIFKKFHEKYPYSLFAKFNYNIMSQAIKAIIQIDHSLCVSKFVLFYYKNVHLMPITHIGEICNSVFISKFYNLFFHWSFEVRDKFYYFILYIIGFRLRDKIPYQDIEEIKLVHIDQVEGEFNAKKTFGEILETKLELINQIKEIIKIENFDANYNNVIPKKYNYILRKLPPETHKNIVVSINQYQNIYNDYSEWERIYSNKKDNEIEYPILYLVPPKDDVVEYEQ